ncbi:MAG: cytochrome c oxidase subunit II [Thermomicrobium sp.]|nr:cytochrome c oxidase subunit II [Thermomicrobium sp.]MDW8060672.1 cytochrome c oxidase subunit II [Thermomicrobium sp.]
MQVGVGVVFFLFVILWTAVLWWVATRASRPTPYEAVTRVVSWLRRWGTLAVLVVLAIAFVVSLFFLPYRASRAARLGEPSVTVEVTGRMWAWELSRTTLPLGQTVEFVVTATDVNHGFGIFAPDGRLVTQVQAMPGYTNRLLYRFDEPGTYTIRCLEFCATGHHVMRTEFVVE